jgi:hypothetical protein
MSRANKVKDRGPDGKIMAKYDTRADKPNYMCWSTPSWWTRMTYHVPRRQDTRRMIHQIMRGADPDGITFWPGNNKPHEYYW